MSVKIGIDLGTTNTLVMTEQKGKLKNIKFNGSNNLPSVVFFDKGEVIVGEKAKQLGIYKPKKKISSAKTYMGDFNHSWNIEGKKINSTMVATEVLKEVREKVVKKLKLDEDEEIEAVITVPAYFTSNQKDETRKAAKDAGLKVLKIITEPVAAAIAYGLEIEKKENLFVFDLGGGTFDIAILEANPLEDEYKTIALDGDKKLGGDDFDNKLLNSFITRVAEDTGINFNEEPTDEDEQVKYAVVRAKLLNLAEKTKIALSETEEVVATENYLLTLNGEDYHFEMIITREYFNEICADLIERIEAIIFRCLRESKLTEEDIDKVVMVGGSSNLPFVYDLLKDIFVKEPYSNLDAGNLVVNGAAIIASKYDGLGNAQIKVTERISHSLGIELVNEKYAPILIKGSEYSVSNSDIFTTACDYQETVTINVFEGEDKDNVNNNEFYGGFELTGIEKAKAGIPQIKVEFSFDRDGILVVTAEDIKTKAKKTVEIKKGEKLEIPQQLEKSDIALLMDLSGSMSGSRIEEAVKAGVILVDNILDFKTQKLSIVGFANRAEITCNLTNNKKELIDAVYNLKNVMNRGYLGGGTNMQEGLIKGMTALKYSDNKKVIILVTDGEDGNDSRYTAKVARQQGIDIYAIGVYGADKRYLQELTNDSERYFMLNNINQLQDTFKTIINGLKYKK